LARRVREGTIRLEHDEALNLKLQTLTIFRTLLRDEVLGGLSALLALSGKGMAERLAAYADFVSSLFQEGENLTDLVWDRVVSDENPYVKRCARGEAVSPGLSECLENELKILEEVSQLSARMIKDAIGFEGYLPEWKTRPADFVGDYARFLRNIATCGYGVFLKHHMFSASDGWIAPVYCPDPVRLSDLKGYGRERKAVVDNTLALLSGKPAANALLYGDAGTGKSSTIKAVVNECAAEGLRLIEFRKNQLHEIPAVAERLRGNPLKFILFIDVLSFTQDSAEVGALKAILEGTASARTKNVVIYATSNRRHIVSERFSDRGDDEIHRSETIQEQVSLSQRFGLAVSFMRPDRAQYLLIVRELALQYGVNDLEALDLLAERYAIERGGRSPRIARQFVETLMRTAGRRESWPNLI
jgi:predicted AAA+ superfamily ATPase